MRARKFIGPASIAMALLIAAPPVHGQSIQVPILPDKGLVRGMDTIGKTLLGDQGFAANILTVGPTTGVEIRFAESELVPIWVNVQYPPSPCVTAMRFAPPNPVDPTDMRIFYNPAVMPIAPVVVPASLELPPNPISPSAELRNGPLPGLASVGRALFGRSAFDAYAADIGGTTTLLLYFGAATETPAFIDISFPPNPIGPAVRMIMGLPGGVVIEYDPDVLAEPPSVEPSSFVDFLPSGCGTEITPSTMTVSTAGEAEPPKQPTLEQSFPNPFNPTTTIRYSLTHGGFVELGVYDVAGRLVRTLIAESMPAGSHAVEWDGRDDVGRSVASGVYLYRLRAEGRTLDRKMVLLK